MSRSVSDLPVPVKLAGFALLMLGTFLAAGAVGAATGDTGPQTPETPSESTAVHGDAHGSAPTPVAPASGSDDLTGLAVAAGGYRLVLDRTTLERGPGATLGFEIVDPEGATVESGYTREHGRDLHLIVVRRDMEGFEHVHPRMDTRGRWSTTLDLTEPGAYKVFADFSLGTEDMTLAADAFVPGEFSPAPWPAEASSATVDGFDVQLHNEPPLAGEEAMLEFDVTDASGGPDPRIDPYLGAMGHLVILREGDLGYLHVHPTGDEGRDTHAGSEDESGAANGPAFATTFPTAGRYRLFLQFKSGGEIHTATYSLEVPR